MLATWVAGALLLGLLARLIGLPPLVGFLGAGFLFSAAGVESTPVLEELSHAGVLLLLFAVGLKLQLRTLLRTEIWATALIHLAIIGALGYAAISGVVSGWKVALALAVALGFSSTVFAAKVLEEKREVRGLHGRIAIAVLIVQDIVAVALLALLDLGIPSPWALTVLLLPLLRPVLYRLLDFVGHGELMVLSGVVIAVTAGGHGFELVGLSPELGALVLGIVFADHRNANELSVSIWSLKEFFLIGFFLSIGLTGALSVDIFGKALLLLLLLPVKALLFFALLLLLGLRARTSFLSAAVLMTFSEFGLIVAQAAVGAGLLGTDWLIAGAIAVALSFLIAAPLNTIAHPLYAALDHWLIRLERDEKHPDDQPVSIGSAEFLVVGMGRVGTGAFDHLRELGESVVGVDSDVNKVSYHLGEGRRVVYADAEDTSLWHHLNTSGLRAILLALPDLEAKQIASRELRASGYKGLLSATHTWDEEREPILAAGCDVTYNYFNEAGVGLARDSWNAMPGAKAAQERAPLAEPL
ncbi:MAG: cation:proton antiporter [Woeseiaceae bacterium]|jgi:predicted Kef-type K+ transport protein